LLSVHGDNILIAESSILHVQVEHNFDCGKRLEQGTNTSLREGNAGEKSDSIRVFDWGNYNYIIIYHIE
jgi:hypothetical protein